MLQRILRNVLGSVRNALTHVFEQPLIQEGRSLAESDRVAIAKITAKTFELCRCLTEGRKRLPSNLAAFEDQTQAMGTPRSPPPEIPLVIDTLPFRSIRPPTPPPRMPASSRQQPTQAPLPGHVPYNAARKRPCDDHERNGSYGHRNSITRASPSSISSRPYNDHERSGSYGHHTSYFDHDRRECRDFYPR